jgi:hypothetical protein
MKIPASIILLVIFSSFIQGQTLVSLNGGLNLATFISHNDDAGTITGYPSWGAGLEIKGRKPGPMHLGFSAEYLRTSINRKYEESHGLGSNSWKLYDINYDLDYLRLSIFPEFMIGKRFQFFCNLSPYFSFMIQSSRNGTYTTTDNTTPHKISGTASGDIGKFDFGIQESMGFGYAVKSFFVLSIEEKGSLGMLDINKFSGGVYPAGLNIFFCLSFIIPKSKPEEPGNPK